MSQTAQYKMKCHQDIIIIKILTTAVLINIALCDWKDTLKSKVDKLKHKGKEMYGEFTEKATKKWEFEIIDKLGYPQYYACCATLAETVTEEGRLPSVGVAAYVGAVAVLNCSLCMSPEDKTLVSWWYSPSLTSVAFEPMAEKETLVQQDGDVIIYHVEAEDAGVYHCQIGDSNGSLVLLEVFHHEEPYLVVKPPSSQGPYPSPNQLLGDATLLSQWSPWSECSRCGRVGRRRRYGYCYITQHIDHNETNGTVTTEEDTIKIYEDGLEIFKAFPWGLPCRSQYLPSYIRNHPPVEHRRSEIMMALCKVTCKENVMFEVLADGRVLEAANNSAGVYSLLQPLPPQPPAPARDIAFVARAGRVNLTCPGTTLRDMPFTWKIGTRDVVARDLLRSSGGRMFISARDHLVITSIKYTDTNLYSCWQDGVLAGSVKLEVWEGGQSHWNHHLTLLAMMLTVAVTLRVALRVLHNKRRKISLL